MDIEEYKKLARNKIEADSLTRQVRDAIKITKWQKQDVREGFKESFKPLIKSQDSIKKSIDEQQNATIAQLKKNQLELKSGLEKINETNLRLTDMKELPEPDDDWIKPPPDDSDGWNINWVPLGKPLPKPEGELEKKFNGDEINLLREGGYPRPSKFNETNIKELEEKIEDLNNDIKEINGRITGRRNIKNPSPEYVAETRELKEIQGTLKKYRNTINTYFKTIKYKVGQGNVYFNNPHQLLDRLELLGGSILAGNNGVIPEFSQIAHLLSQMKVISKKQLNDLLKSYISIK